MDPGREHAAYEEFQAVNRLLYDVDLTPAQRVLRETWWLEAASLGFGFDSVSTDEVVQGIGRLTKLIRLLLPPGLVVQ